MNQDKIRELITTFVGNTPFSIDDIKVEKENSDVFWCLIKTKEPHFFIGRGGENLSAFNHLIQRIAEKLIEKENGFDPETALLNRSKIVVDVNGYQKNKIEELKSLAHTLSERALFFKNTIETEPMSSYDRRIIHEFLLGKNNIQTESAGVEPYRRVIIKYTA